jgi:hypothetical protein
MQKVGRAARRERKEETDEGFPRMALKKFGCFRECSGTKMMVDEQFDELGT